MSQTALPDQLLNFTPEQKEQIDQSLLRLAKKLKAPLVMIADISGQLLMYQGKLSADHSAGLSALAAGGFAAGMEIGNYLGLRDQNQFRQQLLEGKAVNLYTVRVGTELLLITAFTRQTNLGLVRIFAERAQQEILTIAQAASSNPRISSSEDTHLDEAMGSSINQQMDDLFAE